MLANATIVTDVTFQQEMEQVQGTRPRRFLRNLVPALPPHRADPRGIAAERRAALRVATIDTDENVQTTVRFHVRSAPTLLLFKDGQVIDRIVGAVPKGAHPGIRRQTHDYRTRLTRVVAGGH